MEEKLKMLQAEKGPMTPIPMGDLAEQKAMQRKRDRETFQSELKANKDRGEYIQKIIEKSSLNKMP